MLVCDTADIRRYLGVDQVVDVIRNFLPVEHDKAEGKRERLVGDSSRLGNIVSTSGRIYRGPVCFSGTRLYHTNAESDENSQDITLLYSDFTGALECIANGLDLGEMRNGALGAIAASACVDDSKGIQLLVIGAGRQAYAQVEYLLSTLNVSEVHVHCRKEESFERLRARVGMYSDVPMFRVQDIDAQQCHADLIVTATDSAEPVLRADNLKDGVHINFIGAKKNGRQEVSDSVINAMDVLMTDSIHQFRNDANLFSFDACGRDVIPLDALDPTTTDLIRSKTLFMSNCLPGGELVILDAYADAVSED